MNKDCKKWQKQLEKLQEKYQLYRESYQDALQESAQRAKQHNEAFTKCRLLKEDIKPLIIKIKKDLPPFLKYNRFITGLTFSKDSGENEYLKVKLREMVSESNYRSAVDTAMELDQKIKVPSYGQIIQKIIGLGKKKLEIIARCMDVPELIISPALSVEDLCAEMDKHLHYQGDEYNASPCELDSSVNWTGKRKKVGVSIVDMAQIPSYPDAAEFLDDEDNNYSFLDSRKKQQLWKNFFEKRGLRLIKDYEYAVAIQKSLKAFKEAENTDISDPRGHILDCYPPADDYSATVLYPNKGNKGKVAVGYFETTMGQIILENLDEDNYDYADHMTGRGALEIM